MDRLFFILLLHQVVLVLTTLTVAMCTQDFASSEFLSRRSMEYRKPIIGGKLVKAIDAGWQVAIIYKRRLICGGTLLDDSVVLTSAGCVKDLEPAHMQVRAGTTSFKNGGQVRKIRETVHHPDFDEETLANDVALMHLMVPFNATESHLRLIELPDERVLKEMPNTVTIYGWGTTGRNRNTTMTRHIRNSKARIYSNKRCAQNLIVRELVDMFFCAGDRMKNVDICNDDLGGPAFGDHDIQIGIISESSGCSTTRHTTIFTKVLPHTTWIKEAMNEMKSSESAKKTNQKTQYYH